MNNAGGDIYGTLTQTGSISVEAGIWSLGVRHCPWHCSPSTSVQSFLRTRSHLFTNTIHLIGSNPIARFPHAEAGREPEPEVERSKPAKSWDKRVIHLLRGEPPT